MKQIKSQSILSLDDEFDIIITIKDSLQKHVSISTDFTDPLLALKHFRLNAASYGLVISDIRMPQMNGFEFIKKGKEIKFFL
jgi:CheY-like chemotaxis protein